MVRHPDPCQGTAHNTQNGRTCITVGVSALYAVARPAAADATGVDSYVGDAAITRDRMFHRLTDEDWHQVIVINVDRSAQRAPVLRTVPAHREPPGRVVLNSSPLGHMACIAGKARIGRPGPVRRGLAWSGTTVNRVPPRVHRYPDDRRDARPGAGRDGERTRSAGPGNPPDIAGAVASLGSAGADFITGHIVDINDGPAL